MATRYSQELPDDVVRVPINHELAITIAKDFGIHASPLNKWLSWPALSGANSLRVTRAENNVHRELRRMNKPFEPGSRGVLPCDSARDQPLRQVSAAEPAVPLVLSWAYEQNPGNRDRISPIRGESAVSAGDIRTSHTRTHQAPRYREFIKGSGRLNGGCSARRSNWCACTRICSSRSTTRPDSPASERATHRRPAATGGRLRQRAHPDGARQETRHSCADRAEAASRRRRQHAITGPTPSIRATRYSPNRHR